jgi:biopolymer transport protein ExbD
MYFGAIKQNKIHSPLAEMAVVRPTSSNVNMLKVAAPLMLTSLVDAFAVIVIYLLVSSGQQGGELKMSKEISLPLAQQSKALEAGVNVRVVKNQYIVNDKNMSANQVLVYLTQLNKELIQNNDQRKGHLVIQADKESQFDGISPLLLVASQSGFENIKFAVMGE